MSSLLYICVNDQAVPEPDTLKWSAWFESTNRMVSQSMIGDVRVQTDFIGIDQNAGMGDPLLWETMVFGGKYDGYQDRYSSAIAAQVGHEQAVAIVKGEFTPEMLAAAAAAAKEASK